MNNCLILIDLQNDYFPGGNMELVGINEAVAKARLILDQFRTAHLPVIHIQHIAARSDATFFLPGTKGVKIHDLVAPLENEIVVKKNYPNSFRETELLKILHAKKINTLTICGAMSHMCIDATTRAAFDLGFACIVAEDACATKDLVFKEKTINASEVHASFMAALSPLYSKVLATEDILKSHSC